MEETETKKFYIRPNGELIFIPFNDESTEITDNYITLSKEQWDEHSNLEWGKKRIVEDGVIKYVEDEGVTSGKDYKVFKIENEIYGCQQYLAETDYIITKLTEARLESESEYEALKAFYAEQLEKRKEARKKINELSKEIENL